MTDQDEIQFSVNDEIEGEKVSPLHVPLGLLKSFASEVAKFLTDGDEDHGSDDLIVSVRSGSLAYVISRDQVSPGALLDLRRLSERKDVDLISSARRKVIASWQRRAKRRGSLSYSIFDCKSDRRVNVTAVSQYAFTRGDDWIWVERTLVGYITEAGGRSKPNIHVRMGDKPITISASENILAGERRNLLFKSVAMRVRAKHDLTTNELRDYELMEFVEYESNYSEADVQRAIAIGTQAWADVEDAASWVREIRGTGE